MAYRGPTQDEVDADMDSEAAIRLAEAGGDIMQVSMPIGANVAQWNVALARAAESLGQAGPSATVADAGAVRAALAGSTPQSGAVQMLVTGRPIEVGTEGTLPSATIVEDTGAAVQYGTPYENVEMGAYMRTSKKRSRNELLKTKWFCGYCRHYTLRTENRCGNCQTAKDEVAGHEEAAAKRLKARESTKKGRQQNRAGAGAAEGVEREAVATFGGPEHDAAVERETAALSAAVGDPVSNSAEESKLGVVEGFLLLHYKGEHSVQPNESGNVTTAQGITGHVVANFLKSTCAEIMKRLNYSIH